MQCIPEATGNNNEKNGRKYSSSKKYFLEHRDYKNASKTVPRLLSTLVPKYYDQGRVSFANLKSDEISVPSFYLSLQGCDKRNILEHGTKIQKNSLDLTFLQSEILFQVDILSPHINFSEHLLSNKSFSLSKMPTTTFLSEVQSRVPVYMPSKFVQNSSRFYSNPYGFHSISGSIYEDFVPTSLAWKKNACQVDKHVKVKSRGKVKKKGQQCKKNPCRSNGETGLSVIKASETKDIEGDDKDSEYNMIEESTVHKDVLKGSDTDKVNHCKEATCIPYVDVPVSHSTELSPSHVNEDLIFGKLELDKSTNCLRVSEDTSPLCLKRAHDFHQNQESQLGCISPDLLSPDNISPVLTPFSDNWNSDIIRLEPRVDEIEVISVLSLDGSGSIPCAVSYSSTTKMSNSCQNVKENSIKSDVHLDSNSDRINGVSLASCSGHSGTSKRGRQCSKATVNSGVSQRSNRSSSMYSSPGKDQHNAIWQKIQRHNVLELVSEPKNTNPPYQLEFSSKVLSVAKIDELMEPSKNDHKRSNRFPPKDRMHPKKHTSKMGPNHVKPDAISVKSKDDSLPSKSSEKIRNKHNPTSHQERNQHSRKNHGRSTGSSKIDRCKIDHYINDATILERISDNSTEPPQDTQHHIFEMKVEETTCINTTEEETVYPSNNFQIPGVSETTLIGGSHKDDIITLNASNRILQFGPETSNASSCKLDHHLGPVLQKWIPVIRKEGRKFNRSDSYEVHISNLNGTDSAWKNNNTEERVTFDLHQSNSCNGLTIFNANNSSIVSKGQRYKFENQIPHNKGGDQSFLASNCNPDYTLIEKTHEMHESSLASSCDSVHSYTKEKTCSLDDDTNQILKAVKNAHRWQIESELIQISTGAAIAEFEKLCNSASPVIDQVPNGGRNCINCQEIRRVHSEVCRHRIPNISLRDFWKWYEKPGSYGLEVKAEDLNHLGSDYFTFRAYFVPFLSAVQLFGHGKNSMSRCKDKPVPNVIKDCSSVSNQFPIMSILLPQSGKVVGKRTDQSLIYSLSESSSKSDVDECNQSTNNAFNGAAELLFEYFESDQPQQRKPLFEKIKQLVRGDKTPPCQTFGDPLYLDCSDLHSLHPASWYSVAWYPIYRIPDGGFRVAFLTYHSLGHFVQKICSSDSLSGDTSIVSPVVGLQSYNAQGECWFELRNFTESENNETIPPKPSEILKERLKSLEETASTMARASVCKGNIKSPNRQPDYEFFLSRKR